jgi:hypothetical protein
MVVERHLDQGIFVTWRKALLKIFIFLSFNFIAFQNQIPSNGIETEKKTRGSQGKRGFKTKFRLTELKPV